MTDHKDISSLLAICPTCHDAVLVRWGSKARQKLRMRGHDRASRESSDDVTKPCPVIGLDARPLIAEWIVSLRDKASQSRLASEEASMQAKKYSERADVLVDRADAMSALLKGLP